MAKAAGGAEPQSTGTQTLQEMVEADSKAAAAAAEEKPAETEQPEPEAEEPTEEESDDDPLAITKFFDEQHGFDDAAHFRSDAEWLRSVAEAKRLVGQRNDDAQLGKQVRERLSKGDTDLVTLLSGDGRKPAEKPGDGLPELRREWITFDEEGKIRPAAGAPKDVADRYLARVLALVTQPPNDRELASKIKELEDRTESLRAELSQGRELAELDTVRMRHRDVLFVGGDLERGMTPLGESLAKAVASVADTPGQAARILDALVPVVTAAQPKAKIAKPPGRAMRQTPVSQSTGHSDEELDKLLLTPNGLELALKRAAGFD